MATKPKRSTTAASVSSKPKVTKASVKPSSVAVKPRSTGTKRSGAVSKQTVASRAFWNRTKFIFYVVLVAAALLAISFGLMTYHNSKTMMVTGSTDTTGVLFLQSLDGSGTHKAGDTISVTLYEDSGKQAVNALQAGIKYPAEKLQVQSVKTGTAFTQEAATDTATPGLVRIARAIQTGTSSIKGVRPVATIQFKVLSDSSEPFQLTIDDATSLLVRSSDSQNILSTTPSNKLSL